MSPLTPEQLALRQEGIGASEVPVLAGLSPYSKPIDVWARKVGLVEPEPENQAQRIGNALEATIATLYEQDMGVRLQPSGTLRHRIFPWALATPDRIVEDGNKLVEIKVVGARMARDWGTDESDSIPEYVRAQVEFQMAVVGVARCDVAALIGGTTFRIYQIERDAELAAMLLKIAQDFWEQHVIPRIPPEIDGSEAAKRYLAARWPKNGGAMLRAETTDNAIALRLAAARKAKAEDEEEAELCANLMRNRIGDADGIEGTGWKATWKAAKDSRSIEWEALARELGATAEQIQKFTITKPGSRRFVPSGQLFKDGE